MIFYFSGTGNSLHAAKRLGEHLKDEKLISIAEYTKKTPGMSKPYAFTLDLDERVGFVFPIYAWGPPQQVVDFIDNLSLKNNLGNYIYAVATCGQNTGNTMKLLKKHLMRKMLKLSSGFSLPMPNNYILAGDVNTKDEQARILAQAEISLHAIAARIAAREQDVFLVEKGPMPFLLTNLIHPAFTHQPFKTKAFYATDACNQCGICVKVCNCANIRLGAKDKKPVWGTDCTQCLACIHYCPTRAVQHGKSTVNKGRYTNPNVKWNYLVR